MQIPLRLSEEADARLDRLAFEIGAANHGRSLVADLLLRSLPVEELKELVMKRLQRDLAAEDGWSRSEPG